MYSTDEETSGMKLGFTIPSGPAVFDEYGDVALATIATWTVINGTIYVIDYEVVGVLER